MVRFALPLVIVTGLYQAYRLIGLDVTALFVLPIGVLILAKLALVFSLIAIFLACPMWRVCSPIAGVCDITDMNPTPRGSEEAPTIATSLSRIGVVLEGPAQGAPRGGIDLERSSHG